MDRFVYYQRLPVSVMSGVGPHHVQVESRQFQYNTVIELCLKGIWTNNVQVLPK